MNVIDPTQVAIIREYRTRLDARSQLAEIDDLADLQPALMQATRHALADLEEEVRWLGINLVATVWRMFESAAEEPLPRLEAAVIRQRFEISVKQVFGIGQADRAMARRALRVRYARQPYVLAFAERQCLAYGRNIGERALDDRELGTLFALLGAAIDAMHQAVMQSEPDRQPVRSLFA